MLKEESMLFVWELIAFEVSMGNSDLKLRMDIEIRGKDWVTCIKVITKALGAFEITQSICRAWLNNNPVEHLYVNTSKKMRIRRNMLGSSRRTKRECI